MKKSIKRKSIGLAVIVFGFIVVFAGVAVSRFSEPIYSLYKNRDVLAVQPQQKEYVCMKQMSVKKQKVGKYTFTVPADYIMSVKKIGRNKSASFKKNGTMVMAVIIESDDLACYAADTINGIEGIRIVDSEYQANLYMLSMRLSDLLTFPVSRIMKRLPFLYVKIAFVDKGGQVFYHKFDTYGVIELYSEHKRIIDVYSNKKGKFMTVLVKNTPEDVINMFVSGISVKEK